MLVDVVEFTDPACPFAYSAEPRRRRLEWRYGNQLRRTVRMVGLAEDRSAQERKGQTPAQMAETLGSFERFGMPLARVRAAPTPGTWPACRLVVAARERAPAHADRLLRALRVQGLAHARPIDDETVLEGAMRTAGLDPDETLGFAGDRSSRERFRADLAAARHPGPAALALDDKLADVEPDWDGGGPGRRYTCPSVVLTAGERTLEVPGFQPWDVVATTMANLAPDLELRPWAEDPLAVLRWAGEPLATQEVAAVMDLDDREAARARLTEAGAREGPVGSDAFWTAD